VGEHGTSKPKVRDDLEITCYNIGPPVSRFSNQFQQSVIELRIFNDVGTVTDVSFIILTCVECFTPGFRWEFVNKGCIRTAFTYKCHLGSKLNISIPSTTAHIHLSGFRRLCGLFADFLRSAVFGRQCNAWLTNRLEARKGTVKTQTN